MTEIIRECCKDFILSNDNLEELMCILSTNIDKGLNKETHAKSIVKCFPTYIQDFPSGHEKGKYLALDLGGTNFRVIIIYLDSGDVKMEFETYPIAENIMTGPGDKLFDYIAQCLFDFVKIKGVAEENLPLGFTFSFPFNQEGLTKGTLIKWTKGFNSSGVEGKDVPSLLQQACQRYNKMKINIIAILNDTAGCLMSCAYVDKKCKVGLIVGTGCNACYIEKSENVGTFVNESGKPEIVINTEWGALGDDGSLDFIRTEYDKRLDKMSLREGSQTFEKMISGMYLGEIARLIMEQLTKAGLLFNGEGSPCLFTQGSFVTTSISQIETEPEGQHNICMAILHCLGLCHATVEDCFNVRYICKIVSERSAHLASAGVACLVNRMCHCDITIGVDGSLFRYHPFYECLMIEKISELVSENVNVKLTLSEDGSGRGAALVAAAAANMTKNTNRCGRK